jgi:tRNA-binding EMAP/Myf-like protein
VANLQPATIRGVESKGMLLAATNTDGDPVLLIPDTATESGAEVK